MKNDLQYIIIIRIIEKVFVGGGGGRGCRWRKKRHYAINLPSKMLAALALVNDYLPHGVQPHSDIHRRDGRF